MHANVVYGTLVACIVGLVLLFRVIGTGVTKAANATFSDFQKTYLIAYLLVMMADWLQGPYFYSLYVDYGYDSGQIALLFVCGFLSAMLSGPVLGGLADQYGSKKLSIICCITYSVSCFLQSYPNYPVLMFARVCGGVSTALIFSSFEAWMISEHNRRLFEPALLSQTFALQTFGNGIVAACSGVVANAAAEYNTDGSGRNSARPFQLAIAFLTAAGAYMAFTWPENQPKGAAGSSESSSGESKDFMSSFKAVLSKKQIWMLGLMQSFYESSMYMFVFLWTHSVDPPGTPDAERAPIGMIFSCFMVAVMLGSSIFRYLLEEQKWSIQDVTRITFLIAASCMACGIFTEVPDVLFLAFVGFELATGIYFPTIGTLRGAIIPEENRASVMGWFRVPLNLLVVAFLLGVRTVTSWPTLYMVPTALLAVSLYLQSQLKAALAEEKKPDETLDGA